MRTAFIEQLIEEAKIHDDIFLLVGDLGYSVVESFARQFPDRYMNVGVAEQNMAGIAVGLAMTGYNVYIYSIANFPTLRCMEQIRYDIAYPMSNVKVIAVGGGYSYASLGPSHHATEEIGMLRTIPNMVICAPGDPVETKFITKWSAGYNGPVYIRLGKAGEPVVHDSENINIAFGAPLLVSNQNANQAVITSGSMLYQAITFVKSNTICADVYSLPFIKPLDKKAFVGFFEKYSHIISLEEHQASCGTGSALLEILNDLYQENLLTKMPSIKRIAIPDKFVSVSGDQNYLREIAGIVLKIEDFI